MNVKASQFVKHISSPPPLFKHQQQSIKKFNKTPVIFDTSDPGTGKTRVQIEAFAARRRKKGQCALVLATKSLLEPAWRKDFTEFAGDMKVSIAYAENREEAFNIAADVYVTNHDAVTWLTKQRSTFFKKFDTLILDECTAFKHATSKRSKALAKIVHYFTYRSGMTGTPTSNGITDIWHQVFLLDDGQRLGDYFIKFRNAACDYVKNDKGGDARYGKWIDKEGIEEVVATLLEDITIRHKFEDCVDIPENHRYSVPFQMNRKHRELYEELAKKAFLELKGKPINAVNGAVLYSKLLQIASGAVYSSEGEWAEVDHARYELVADLAEERKHSIVFFTWEHQRDALIKEFQKREILFAVFDGSTKDAERNRIVAAYQKGEYQVLLAHPKSAGHGLTLTQGTATIWASPTYNLEHFLQGLKRVHRIGQTKKTETIVVVAEGTIDEDVWNVCKMKDARQNNLLEILKEQMR